MGIPIDVNIDQRAATLVLDALLGPSTRRDGG